MQLFFVQDIDSDDGFLSEEESKHAVRVLRLKNGDIISLVDGKGTLFEAAITDANPKKCRLKIKKTRPGFGKRDFYLHIACAPTKNIDRFEWFLEKATEAGIDEITPLICKRSERTTVKTERLNKTLVSAMKQSVKAYLPRLNEAVSFEKFCSGSFSEKKFIAHCREGLKPHLKNEIGKNESCLVLIGPEGDFTEEEVIYAKQKGFREINLGNSRLRTETAAIFACNLVNVINE